MVMSALRDVSSSYGGRNPLFSSGMSSASSLSRGTPACQTREAHTPPVALANTPGDGNACLRFRCKNAGDSRRPIGEAPENGNADGCDCGRHGRGTWLSASRARRSAFILPAPSGPVTSRRPRQVSRRGSRFQLRRPVLNEDDGGTGVIGRREEEAPSVRGDVEGVARVSEWCGPGRASPAPRTRGCRPGDAPGPS